MKFILKNIIGVIIIMLVIIAILNNVIKIRRHYVDKRFKKNENFI